MTEYFSVGGREVRRIPKRWQHPKDEHGLYVPLLPEGAWEHDNGIRNDACMPETVGHAEIAAYEAVSEGTPISPAFPDTAEGRLALLRHCAEHCTTFADNRADAEAWAAILFGHAAVAFDGRVVAHD